MRVRGPQSVFDLFREQLQGLANPADANFAQYFHLLETLSQYGTCLILCGFDSKGAQEAGHVAARRRRSRVGASVFESGRVRRGRVDTGR